MQDIKFPEKLEFLFQKSRYKVAEGGRGSAKSWSFARALLILGMQEKMRILCAREFQNSIEESVHALLSHQIDAMGMGDFYFPQQKVITGANGTEFLFMGVRHNISKVKSLEKIKICWVEEANKVSKTSWETLIPTLREEGSEIWVSFNPELEEDYTYKHFVLKPPKQSIVVHVTWRDNPWFPQVLEDERLELKEKDHDAYLNIWEGKCRHTLEGAVYAKELRKATEEGRITKVAYDPIAPVSTFWDLGKRDHTSIWFAQRIGLENHVINFYQARGEDLSHYLKELQWDSVKNEKRPYVYDAHFLPHDAKAQRLGSSRSIEEMMGDALGHSFIHIVPKLSVEDGINASRIMMNSSWFDELECAEGLQCLRHYRYDVDPDTKQFSKTPLHDEYSDGADAFRMYAVAFNNPRRKPVLKLASPVRPKLSLRNQNTGWMA